MLPALQRSDSCTGPEEIIGFWEEIDETMEELQLRPQEFRDAGDLVAVKLRHYGKGKGSGLVIDEELYHQVSTFARRRDGPDRVLHELGPGARGGRAQGVAATPASNRAAISSSDLPSSRSTSAVCSPSSGGGRDDAGSTGAPDRRGHELERPGGWGARPASSPACPSSAAAASASVTERTLPQGTPAASRDGSHSSALALARSAPRACGISSVAVLDARGVRREALVLGQLGRARWRAQSARNSPSFAAATAIRPDARLEVLVGDDVRVGVAVAARLDARHERVLGDVHEPGEAAVEQRHLDAAALAAVERGQHARRGVQPGEHVHERHARLVRLRRRAAR